MCNYFFTTQLNAPRKLIALSKKFHKGKINFPNRQAKARKFRDVRQIYAVSQKKIAIPIISAEEPLLNFIKDPDFYCDVS